ncbi:MAG TPA: histidine kinase [Stackebrandtia sp.]|uniref:sensor histidine kinase n=1 Tax=Stackebrandtia sp. TaxID=2023065 RepID=UPI002D71D864|nr:histidine kinase [Stackebrandtia sp.]HZE38348.1 histidine kinase [Stackebrandtia sp.]
MISSDRIHRLGGLLIRIALAGILVLLLFLQFDETGQLGIGPVGYLTLIPGAAGIGLVLFPEGRVPDWTIPLSAASLLLTVLVLVFPAAPGSVQWLAECGALLVLLVWAVRRWGARRGRLGTCLLLAAIVAMPLRADGVKSAVVLEVLLMPMLVTGVVLGIYLYSVDSRRRRALTEVRRGERMELARELHDFVAHHVTGIVVQAQAARYIADDDPARARESFAAIEKAGIEALTSMRRMVAMMREEDSGAGTRPLGDLSQTSELVSAFSLGDTFASLYISPDVTADTLAPEVAASVHRIVRESLTNIRKHAATATSVVVAISAVRDGVEVAVRDDGQGNKRSLLGGVGGGYGLAGLSERVRAIGGQFHAGTRPEGGWEVVAMLPLEQSSSANQEVS